MLIKCGDCGHDNELGAMFCRSCGTKLDVETIRPTVENKAAVNTFGIIRRVVTGIILLILIYIMGSMFFPETTTSKLLTEEQQVKATEKFDALLAKIGGRYGESSYVFTPDELTYLYNNKMTEDAPEDTGSYAIENMYFTIDARNFIHIMMQSKLGGKVPVSFALKGRMVDDSVQFTVIKTKMGHLSLPKFIKKKIIEKFTPGIDEGVIKKIIDGSASFKIENGDFLVTLKKEN